MPSWPSYAHIQLDGYAEQRETALQATEMESGPPKLVRVKSRVMVRRPVAVRFDTRADYAAFIAWFQSDIKHGSLWFDWTDPLTRSPRQARIKDGLLGDAVLLGSAALDRGVRLTLTLETWQ